MSTVLRVSGAAVLATASLTVLSLAGAPAGAASGVKAPAGHLVVVQAVPKEALDVSVDGRAVDRASATGAVLGPISLPAGRHQVEFSDGSGLRLVTGVQVPAGSSQDVVVHLPAQVGGDPVVNSYRTPLRPIAPGKARVLLAHTATVAPADVRVDGAIVFRDIANGEYATADVAAGAHTVALLPAGVDTDPILGPLKLSLRPGTVTMVYAVGNPRTRSMNVILHEAALTSNGATVPVSIDTGTAGLASHVVVHPFVVRRPAAAAAHPQRSGGEPWWPAAVLGLGAAVVVAGWSVRRRATRSS